LDALLDAEMTLFKEKKIVLIFKFMVFLYEDSECYEDSDKDG
jgi:hypothetical protein